MPLKHKATKRFHANYLVGFSALVFLWLNEFLKSLTTKSISETNSIYYIKNEKTSTCFCYKNLFPLVINKEMKNITSDNQPTSFLQTRISPCYFTVIALVMVLLLTVIRQVSFYNKSIKRYMNKYVTYCWVTNHWPLIPYTQVSFISFSPLIEHFILKEVKRIEFFDIQSVFVLAFPFRFNGISPETFGDISINERCSNNVIPFSFCPVTIKRRGYLSCLLP